MMRVGESFARYLNKARMQIGALSVKKQATMNMPLLSKFRFQINQIGNISGTRRLGKAWWFVTIRQIQVHNMYLYLSDIVCY